MTAINRVLVTSGSWGAALCCVESLGSQGLEVFVIDNVRSPSTMSRYCAGWVQAPNEYSTSEYIAWLLRELRRIEYDLLVPISDRAVGMVSRHQAALGDLTTIVLPAPANVLLAADKACTTRLAMELAIATPQSLFPETLDGFPEACDSLGFPCVIKIPKSSASRGVFIVRDPADARSVVQSVARKDNWPFVQAFEPGDTTDLVAVCNRGRIVAYHSFLVKAEHMIGGTPPYAFSFRHEGMLKAARAIVERLEWHGAIDLDFTRTTAGTNLLLEINPRFSGTISFARAQGIDLALALVDVAQGQIKSNYGDQSADVHQFCVGLPEEIDWWSRDIRRRTQELVYNWFRGDVLRVARGGDPQLLFGQLLQTIRIIRRRTMGRSA